MYATTRRTGCGGRPSGWHDIVTCQRLVTTSLSIDGITLPVVKSARDLGVLVSHDLSPSLHISTIAAKAHKRSAAIAYIVRLHVVTLMYLFAHI